MPVLSRFVKPGDRVDVSRIRKNDSMDVTQYHTRVFDIVSDDELKINMPMEGSRLVLLSMGQEYELCFFTSAGLFQCYAVVKDRYKSNNVVVATVELTSGLRKFQRREYYRLNTILDMKCTAINAEQELQFDNHVEFFGTDFVMKDGVIVDISGGGVRFVTKTFYEKDTKIYFSFSLNIGNKPMQFNTLGVVLSSRQLPDRPGEYENRVQFINMLADERETIIKYIFEEERKIRRKEMGE
ncbi:MAG: flagellar brake protein [Lachnospiraceae bacterium]|nr:flagellar brake protein [Lachnospiraceae bacterium]